MNSIFKTIALAAVALLPFLFIALQAEAEPNRTTMPDIDKLVHYTTVTRGEVTEHIMTTPEAIAAVKAGGAVPEGTHFVLVDYRGDKVFRYFVMEKGRNFGADYDESRRTGDWQFQWFKPDGSINLDENTARCQACHSSRSDREFLYTYNEIRRFETD